MALPTSTVVPSRQSIRPSSSNVVEAPITESAPTQSTAKNELPEDVYEEIKSVNLEQVVAPVVVQPELKDEDVYTGSESDYAKVEAGVKASFGDAFWTSPRYTSRAQSVLSAIKTFSKSLEGKYSDADAVALAKRYAGLLQNAPYGMAELSAGVRIGAPVPAIMNAITQSELQHWDSVHLDNYLEAERARQDAISAQSASTNTSIQDNVSKYNVSVGGLNTSLNDVINNLNSGNNISYSSIEQVQGQINALKSLSSSMVGIDKSSIDANISSAQTALNSVIKSYQGGYNSAVQAPKILDVVIKGGEVANPTFVERSTAVQQLGITTNKMQNYLEQFSKDPVKTLQSGDVSALPKLISSVKTQVGSLTDNDKLYVNVDAVNTMVKDASEAITTYKQQAFVNREINRVASIDISTEGKTEEQYTNRYINSPTIIGTPLRNALYSQDFETTMKSLINKDTSTSPAEKVELSKDLESGVYKYSNSVLTSYKPPVSQVPLLKQNPADTAVNAINENAVARSLVGNPTGNYNVIDMVMLKQAQASKSSSDITKQYMPSSEWLSSMVANTSMEKAQAAQADNQSYLDKWFKMRQSSYYDVGIMLPVMFGTGTYEGIRTQPLETAELYLATAGISAGLSALVSRGGATATALTAQKILKVPKVMQVAGIEEIALPSVSQVVGTGLTGLYVADVATRVAAEPNAPAMVHKAGSIFSTEWAPMSAGVMAGVKGYERASDIAATWGRTEIPIESVATKPIISGEQQLPMGYGLHPNDLIKKFEVSGSKLPGGDKGIKVPTMEELIAKKSGILRTGTVETDTLSVSGGFHATSSRGSFKPETIKVTAGDRSVFGMHAADETSLYFLRLDDSASSYSVLPSLFPQPVKPSVQWLASNNIERMPKNIRDAGRGISEAWINNPGAEFKSVKTIGVNEDANSAINLLKKKFGVIPSNIAIIDKEIVSEGAKVGTGYVTPKYEGRWRGAAEKEIIFPVGTEGTRFNADYYFTYKGRKVPLDYRLMHEPIKAPNVLKDVGSGITEGASNAFKSTTGRMSDILHNEKGTLSIQGEYSFGEAAKKYSLQDAIERSAAAPRYNYEKKTSVTGIYGKYNAIKMLYGGKTEQYTHRLGEYDISSYKAPKVNTEYAYSGKSYSKSVAKNEYMPEVRYEGLSYKGPSYKTIEYTKPRYNEPKYTTSEYKPQEYKPTRYEPQRYTTKLYKLIRYDNTRYNPTRYEPTRYDNIRYNPNRYNPIRYGGTEYTPQSYRPPTYTQPTYKPPKRPVIKPNNDKPKKRVAAGIEAFTKFKLRHPIPEPQTFLSGGRVKEYVPPFTRSGVTIKELNVGTISVNPNMVRDILKRFNKKNKGK